jgi:dTDP-4-dehydrorhamnose reductase
MTWMIVGANGQLACCLLDRLPRDIDVKAFSHGELDITNEAQLLQVVEQVKPAVIINCAAYTQVDLAEENPQHAFAVNAFGVENLARCANHVGALVVHISTDYVFAGDADTPYGVDGQCEPKTVYGQSKLEGERLLAAAANNFVIVRTAWLYSEYGQNFVKTMLKLAKNHAALKVVDDQIGCPTYAGDLASFIIWLVESGQYRNQITHFAGDSALSWAGFATVIFKQAVELGRLDCAPEVIAIPSSEYAFKTPRPAYSVLATTPSPISNDWQASLKYVLERINL